MPRREAPGDVVYHVLNRGAAGRRLFDAPGDYLAFETVLGEAHERVRMRTVAYCIMPNHWHFVLWPRADGDLSRFMYWLTMTHAKRWHGFRESTGDGHVYQGRFKAIPVESDRHFLTVCRYVERNPLRAGLVRRSEDWSWSSLHHRLRGDAQVRVLLADGPLPWPDDWLDLVHQPVTQAEKDDLRRCIHRGLPFGRDVWTLDMARRLGIEARLRPRGRPLRRGAAD